MGDAVANQQPDSKVAIDAKPPVVPSLRDLGRAVEACQAMQSEQEALSLAYGEAFEWWQAMESEIEENALRKEAEEEERLRLEQLEKERLEKMEEQRRQME